MINSIEEKEALHIALIAGEKSGDEIGAYLIQAIRKQCPNARFSGSPGPAMREEKCTSWEPMESFQVMGLFDVLKKIPTLFRAKRALLQAIEKEDPDIILFIDQPSFSAHLAKKVRGLSMKKRQRAPLCIQVVAPSVWAYHEKRAKKVKNYFDAILLLYQFEIPYFSDSLPTYWIGHPSMDPWREKKALIKQEKEPIIALYPGSRPDEIRRNLPIQLDAAKKAIQLLAPIAEFSIAIQCTDTITLKDKEFFKKQIEKRDLLSCTSFIPFSKRYELMKKARGAFAKSGTITLELALSNTPTIVSYQIGYFTKIWAKKILKISPQQKFALPNIITKRSIFPEYIQETPSAEMLALALVDLLQKNASGIPKSDLESLYSSIFPSQKIAPADIAALHILDLLNSWKSI